MPSELSEYDRMIERIVWGDNDDEVYTVTLRGLAKLFNVSVGLLQHEERVAIRQTNRHAALSRQKEEGE
jgi:hypothetical protein